MRRVKSWLSKLSEPRWPPGEPLASSDGFRYGTRLDDGTIVFAPGIKVSRDEEAIRFLVRDEISKRERELAREIQAVGFAKLINWGRPPPPLDRGQPR
ncbi:hypothetical protein [Bradyrhizobium sp. 192]|uniref:hypothetical protein n=1 Tax=Bradyrhizobium sp. 192 TaxID=2782660 RepID=UPI001FFF6563|nr:hypothetical protein [Bradyrhizobium sp. 192]UPJ55437.1 hypothetical protein IVB24_22530 [Bradyrhizobium sp. 192]